MRRTSWQDWQGNQLVAMRRQHRRRKWMLPVSLVLASVFTLALIINISSANRREDAEGEAFPVSPSPAYSAAPAGKEATAAGGGSQDFAVFPSPLPTLLYPAAPALASPPGQAPGGDGKSHPTASGSGQNLALPGQTPYFSSSGSPGPVASGAPSPSIAPPSPSPPGTAVGGGGTTKPPTTGYITINFSRNQSAGTSWSAAEGGTAQRPVADLLSYLTFYRVRIQGNGADLLRDVTVAGGEVSLSVKVTAGKGYTVKILALGPDIKGQPGFPLIMGAGSAAGVGVPGGGEVVVQVPMKPFGYEFTGTPASVSAGTPITVNSYLHGFLLEDIFSGSGNVATLRYMMGSPVYDNFPGGVTGNLSFINPGTASAAFTIPPQAVAGQLYFQVFQSAGPGWTAGGKTPVLVAPALVIDYMHKIEVN